VSTPAVCGQSRSLVSVAGDDCIFYAKRGTVQLRCLRKNLLDQLWITGRCRQCSRLDRRVKLRHRVSNDPITLARRFTLESGNRRQPESRGRRQRDLVILHLDLCCARRLRYIRGSSALPGTYPGHCFMTFLMSLSHRARLSEILHVSK
jgi:hypothetical protein